MIHSRLALLLLATVALASCGKSDDAASTAASAEALKPIPAPAGTSWTDRIETTPEGGVRMGNPAAPIKMVEYGSLSCPACARLAQDGFDTLMKDYVGSGRVSFEFRSFIMHPQDIPLTMLARCGPLETFLPMAHQIYVNFEALEAPLLDEAVKQKANVALQGPPAWRVSGLADALGYTQFFAARGLPADKARTCLADLNKAKEFSDMTQKYAADGVNQTPTVLINGDKLDEGDWANVERALKQAGAS